MKVNSAIPFSERLLLTIEEVAEELHLSRSGVNQIMRNGTLPSVRLGRRRLIRRNDLEAFVSRLSSKQVMSSL